MQLISNERTDYEKGINFYGRIMHKMHRMLIDDGLVKDDLLLPKESLNLI